MSTEAFDLHKLRACMVCGLVRNFEQFKGEGCLNCDHFLQMRGSNDRVMDCTTPSFSGLVAIIRPGQSWLARWQRREKAAPGLYALKVIGRLSEDILDITDSQGIKPFVESK